MLRSSRAVSVALLACVSVIGGGCNALFGVDELSFDDGAGAGSNTTATTSTASGSGSTGGGDATTSGASSSSTSSGAGGGGGPAVDCGTIDAFADDFNDGEMDLAWSDDGAPDERGGVLTLALPGTGEPAVLGYKTRQRYDLHDSAMAVEVLQCADGTGTETSFSLQLDGDNDIEFECESGKLYTELEAGGMKTRTEFPYDRDDHRWWRIRESSGTFYWEVSKDGSAWTELRQAPTAGSFAIDALQARLRADTEGSMAPGTTVFDNFNGGAATGVLCKTELATDDFAGSGAKPDHFLADVEDCGVEVVGGELVLTLAAAATGGDNCSVRSERLYDLTDSSVTVELTSTPTAGPVYAWIGVNDPAHDPDEPALTLEIFDGDLRVARWLDAPTVLGSIRYDEEDHRWLRLREQGGAVVADASADGSSWETIYSGTANIDTSRVVIEFGVWTTVSAGGQSASFDNLNLAP